MASMYSCSSLVGIGVVEAQVALAAELLRDAEIERDRLGVADMEIAVRLRRKAGDHLLDAPGGEVSGDNIADEIARRSALVVALVLVCDSHPLEIPFGARRLSAKPGPQGQAANQTPT